MAKLEADWTPNYNLAPTDALLAVCNKEGKRELTRMKWGLVPSWADNSTSGPRPLNARCESVADKPTFRAAIRERRCLLPASGFYEWLRRPGQTPQPYYFHAADDAPLAFAGIWERWEQPGAEPLETCCLLTTSANALMSPIHDRLPVFIYKQDFARWLDPALRNPEQLVEFFSPAAENYLSCHPVSTRVNRVGEKGPELIGPVSVSLSPASTAPLQGEMFAVE